MEYNAFIEQLSRRASTEAEECRRLADALADVLAAAGEEMAEVCVPRFGTFVTEKYAEEVDTDLSTGRRVLLPPRIAMSFTPGAVLRKAVEKGGAR